MRYVVFLRAVNVAGRIAGMESLRHAFVSLGFANVKTYIQSGNVLFDAPRKREAELCKRIETTLHELLGYEVPTFLRTMPRLFGLVDDTPFGDRKASVDLKLYVTFLSRPLRKPPDLPLFSPNRDLEVIAVRGADVFTLSRRYRGRFGFPNNFVEDALRVQATSRNWETIRKMMQAFA